ncbi:MAG TPA: hypothetical protein VGO89_21360 [Streptomyces sp.]|jgi:ribosomal protein L40E|nr:hypothetical protein [Streptomyces sp.]
MPTTCPNCGAGSPATADSCAGCGRDLYRLKDPVTKASFGLGSGIGRMRMLVTVSLAALLLGGGVSTASLLGLGADDGTEGQNSQNKPSGPTVTPTPKPTATPSSREPAEKEPPKPEPTRHQPRPSTPPRAEPTREIPVDDLSPEIRRRLQESGISVDPYADPTDAENWHVDRNGNVNVSR